MIRIILAVLVLLTVAGCTSTGTMWGTRSVSMWDRGSPDVTGGHHAAPVFLD